MNRYEKSALQFVNKIRRSLGGEPIDALLPGIPGKTNSCPIARSIRADDLVKGVNADQFNVEIGLGPYSGRKKIPTPKGARKFIANFDNDVDGKYDHLNDRKLKAKEQKIVL